tara:strand:- start:386 stop:619 length:234 start_codon:yes stop_codon:yes gene_type:complete
MIDEKVTWAATELNSKFGNHKQAGKVLLCVIADLMAELEAAKAPAKKAPAKKTPAKKATAKKAPAKKSTKRKTTTKK